jgi:WD40 repeat protein
LPPFSRLAVSPNGEYVAGVNAQIGELRFAVSGGLQARAWGKRRGRCQFVSFSPDSRVLACGWDHELHVLDTQSGRHARRAVESGPVPFRDGAFTGTGWHFGTVDESGVLKLWDAERWEVDRAYDWQAGPLTCVAFTADGLAGVCGTAGGHLVLFDLD